MNVCPLCNLPPETRREVDRDIIDHRLPWSEIARVARCSRKAVTKHSKHLSEVLPEEHRQAPIFVNFAPSITVCVLAPDEVEEDEVEEEMN